MTLSSDLISQFVKVTNDNKETKSESTLYGRIVIYNDREYVQLDGSDVLTPITSTTSVEAGERVLVTIKDHTATVTGNISSPSVGSGVVEKVENKVDNAIDQISEFEIVITEKIVANDAEIKRIVAENAKIAGLLEAEIAEIESLKAKDAEIEGTLEAANADIDNLKVNKLDVEVAESKYATIENLEATNADFHNLEATYADFEVATIKRLEATEAEVKNLDTTYAEIDFSNINQAAVEKLFADSGIIENLVVQEGKITGELVGVTIKGDLIEGNTIKADKLVIKGDNGLYYKLNIEGGSTVTEEITEEDLQNGLDGRNIIARSVTASKIAVDDLVAFDATIGGFNITDDAIYSGVKGGVDSNSPGIYMDNTGQLAFGDDINYLKYYRDGDVWKLDISAKSIIMSGSGKSVEEELNKVKDIKVGGRNLIKTSNPVYVAPTMEVNAVKVDKTVNLIYGDTTKDTFFELRFYGSLKAGEEYTISFDCEGIEEGVEPIYRVQYSTGEDRNFTLTNGRVSKTFVLSQDNTSGFLLLDDNNTSANRPSNTNIILSNFKLEKGNVATDYTPAPEDVQMEIDSIYNENLLTRTRDFGGGWSLYPTTRVGYGYEDGFTHADFPAEETAGTNRWIYNPRSFLDIKDVWEKELTFSYEFRSDEAWTTDSDDFALEFALANESAIGTRIRYKVIYVTLDLLAEWSRKTYTFTANEAFFSGSNGSGLFEDCTHFWVRLYNTSNKPMQMRKFKLEYGNVATDWSAAPEDTEVTGSGGTNLILDSDTERSSANYCVNTSSDTTSGGHYVPSTPLVAGEEYTITICTTPAEGVKCYNINASYGNMNQCYLYVNGTERQITSCTFTPRYAEGYTPEDNIRNANLLFYRLPNDGTVTEASTIHWIKVEKGNKSTDWSPAPEDAENEIANTNSVIKGAVTELNSAIETAQGTANEAKESVSNRQKYVRIVPEDPSISLVATGDDNDTGTKVELTSEKISFYNGETEGAYIGYVDSEQTDRTSMAVSKTYITEMYPRVEDPTTTEENKWVGNLCWIARTNGHLSLKVVK